jgi:hypothetical protein
MIDTRSGARCDRKRPSSTGLNSVLRLENIPSPQNGSWRNLFPGSLHVAALVFACLVAGCAAYGRTMRTPRINRPTPSEDPRTAATNWPSSNLAIKGRC